jgi:hypothetical protein
MVSFGDQKSETFYFENRFVAHSLWLPRIIYYISLSLCSVTHNKEKKKKACIPESCGEEKQVGIYEVLSRGSNLWDEECVGIISVEFPGLTHPFT